MSFIAELRQRKVLRVGGVYLVVAWVAIQAASIALPAFDAPDWTLRFLILLFALGFPLALLLTWALELTPAGVRVVPARIGNKRMALLAVALTGLALGWYFLGQPALRGAAHRAPERSIAVLPFVNMSGNPANEYLSDGLAETTLDMLSQVPDLKVIARTSSFAFKDKPKDMREIGRALGAAHLLEGSVQQAGDTVRITVQLIRADDGTHLWSRRFDRRMTDVFRVQDEIATSVVRALQLRMTAPTQRRLLQKRTDNVAAYQEYLKGMALLPRRNVAEMRRAVTHFERAIALDPTYARAYVAASDTYRLLFNYGSVTTAERVRAKHYVERALDLAPQLGEAYAAQADVLNIDADPVGAARAYKRALALTPGYATAYHWYSRVLGYQFGRTEEALQLAGRAVELDPLSPVIRASRIDLLIDAGRLDEADAAVRQFRAQFPDEALPAEGAALVAAARGDLVQSLRMYRERDRRDPDRLDGRHLVMLQYGAREAAERRVAVLQARAPHAARIAYARASLARYDGDFATALRIVDAVPQPNAYLRAWLLGALGRHAESIALLRRIQPHLFREPPDVPEGCCLPILTGVVLARSGDMAHGAPILRAALRQYAGHPRYLPVSNPSWWDVRAHVALGDIDAAIAALRDGVTQGVCQDLLLLDTDPTLAALRADPRYQSTLAPARARARAQVDAARAQGLL